MDTLIIRAKGVSTGALPKYNTNNIKFVRQGDGTGTISIQYVVLTAQTLTISGGVIVTDEGDVTSLPVTPNLRTLVVRLTSPIGFLSFQKPYLYRFEETARTTRTENSPIIDYTNRTTGLQSFVNMFRNDPTFNRPVSGLQLHPSLDSANASNMFDGATSFNRDLSDLDVSKVSGFGYMFNYAVSFNQDLSGWNVSNSASFQNMFTGASAFNQNLSNWNVSKATNMESMFSSASNFNQDLSGWNLNLEINLHNIFNGCGLSADNYSAFLIMLSERSWTGRTQAKRLGASGVKYNTDGATARAALINDGWTILDGGQE